MTKTQTKTFATTRGPDTEFTITQLTAMRSGKLLMRLTRNIGPGLAGLAGTIDLKSAMSGNLEVGAGLAPAVRELFERLDGDELEYITRELLSTAQVRIGNEIHDVMPLFDTLMQGYVFEWFKLLWFALEVNYGNFSGGLAGLGAKMVATARANGSKGSITSTGPQSA